MQQAQFNSGLLDAGKHNITLSFYGVGVYSPVFTVKG